MAPFSHLPVALVAAFIKRMGRLCLRAPPAAIVSIIPFIYNLLKRHPSCMVLIHSVEQVEPGALYEGEPNKRALTTVRTSSELTCSLHRSLFGQRGGSSPNSRS